MKTTTHFHKKTSYSLSMLDTNQSLNVFKSCLVKQGFKKFLSLIETAQSIFSTTNCAKWKFTWNSLGKITNFQFVQPGLTKHVLLVWMRLTDKNMAMISRVIGTTANFISWDPRVFWEVVLFCLRPKCDYCDWKLTKHPFFTGSPCQSYSICKLLAVWVRQRSYPSSSYQSPEP